MEIIRPERRYRIEIGRPERILIVLVGCGGTGSFLALHLARLMYHAREQHGLNMQMMFVDRDQVEEKNIGRQNFCCAEMGQDKARTLAVRYNRAFGLGIGFRVQRFEELEMEALLKGQDRTFMLICGCVDNTPARRTIADAVGQRRVWWLDGGNHDHSGQVLIGNRGDIERPVISPLGMCVDVPLPSVQCAELVDAPTQAQAPTPRRSTGGPSPASGREESCAELALADVQGLMVNQAVAGWMAVYVSRLLISRDLDVMGTYFDLVSGSARSVGITEGMRGE